MPPQSPNPNFDFIMNENQKPGRSFGLPANLPKPVSYAVLAMVVLILIIIASSLFGGSGGNSDKLYTLLSDAGKIAAASSEASGSAQDPDTANMAATTKAALASQQQQIEAYMTSSRIKVDSKKIASTTDPTLESELKTATANNNYDQVFLTYLKSALNSYQSDLQTVYKTAKPSLQTVLSGAYNSNAIILSSKQLQ